MNREIKYRALINVNSDTEPLKMKYYDLSKTDDCRQFAEDDWAASQLMQYTGIKDMHGNEIYEGDMVRLEYGNAVVKYVDDCGAFMLEWVNEDSLIELLAFSNYGYRIARSRKQMGSQVEIISRHNYEPQG